MPVPDEPDRWLTFGLIAFGIVVAVFAGLFVIGFLLEDSLNPTGGAGSIPINGERQVLHATLVPGGRPLDF